jgi:hypothetical protein
MSMSLRQVRVVDPVLSNVARGFLDQPMVGSALFPRVNVPLSGGQIIEFGKEAFVQYNIRRVPGGATKRVDFGHLGAAYALVQDALEAKVPREWMRDARVSPGVDLGTRAVRLAMTIAMRGLEIEQATIARTAASYADANKIALSDGSRWNDSGVNPSATIEVGREAIRAASGVYPNVALLSAKAFAACRNNAAILDRFKYTSSESVTAEMLARLWDIDRVVVGRGVYATSATAAFQDIWGTDAILAYAPENPSGAEEPSYGYTYMMEGHPLVETPYWDDNAKSWLYPVTIERVPVIAGATSAYLMQTVTD